MGAAAEVLGHLMPCALPWHNESSAVALAVLWERRGGYMPLPAIAALLRGGVGKQLLGAVAGDVLGGGRRRRRRRRTLSNGERADIAFLRNTLGPTHGNAAVSAYLTSRR